MTRKDKHLKNFADLLRRKLSRTSARVAILLAAALTVVLGVPSAALADENYYYDCGYESVACQTGVTNVLVEGQCMTADAAHHKTQMCVDYSGDYVYVYDGQADGYAAMAEVYTTRGTINTRLCRNNYGYDTWARCNFDWVEDASHFAAAGYKVDRNKIVMQNLWQWDGK